jgi:hypothetical protein
MAVTTTDLIMGPADLYIGDFGATEPLDTAINTAPGVAWTDLGGTQDGVKLVIDQTYTELEVDQIVQVPGARKTKEVLTVETNLAQATLDNLKVVLNGGTTASGTGYKSYEPAYATSATQPTYRALLIDGYAPQGFRRRVIVRKVLSNDKVESTYKKDDQTLFSVKWGSFYVTSSIAPYKVVDQTAA